MCFKFAVTGQNYTFGKMLSENWKIVFLSVKKNDQTFFDLYDLKGDVYIRPLSMLMI